MAKTMHVQVVAAIRAHLARAAAGDRLPTVYEISEETDAGTGTIIRAYQALVERGEVLSKQGSGYFAVRDGNIDRGVLLAQAQRLTAELTTVLALLENLDDQEATS